MKFLNYACLAAIISLADARSICNRYSKLLGVSQYDFAAKIVNTAFSGQNCPAQLHIPGVLGDGVYEGVRVSLRSYFDGSRVNTNNHGKAASKNYLDNGENEVKLTLHMTQLFMALLSCSEYGRDYKRHYQGNPSMYEVHKFQHHDYFQTGYFNEQFELALLCYGVSPVEAKEFRDKLDGMFGERCASPVKLASDEPKELQAICLDDNCFQARDSFCSAYTSPHKRW